MKLVDLSVQHLHGFYDYHVSFNSDVTFIYGMNGCGKTTILNITEAIITGELYKLFSYRFKQIDLRYSKHGSSTGIKQITIKHLENSLSVEYNNQEFVIDVIYFDDDTLPTRKKLELTRKYFAKYSFLNDIKAIFNYVYLPLNRSEISYRDEEIYFRRNYKSNYFYDPDSSWDNDSYDYSMQKVEHLIRAHFLQRSATISKYNDEFRNSILKSLVEIRQPEGFDSMIAELIEQAGSISSLNNTKNAYIRMLTELNILSDEEENKYNAFFDHLISSYNSILEKKDKDAGLSLFLQYQEISRIKKLLPIAARMEERKSIACKPLETFLTIMNEFLGNSVEKKTIFVDHLGRVFFNTIHHPEPLRIQYLSSGEKQLITFFANLLFRVKDDSSGIFVVDEPEISLHLSWQKMFVDKALEINKNVQLIFATHSPEIVGRHRSKMYKLERQYTGAE